MNQWITIEGSTIQVMFAGDGTILVSSTEAKWSLRFTKAEWNAFVGGIKDGEFDDLT